MGKATICNIFSSKLEMQLGMEQPAVLSPTIVIKIKRSLITGEHGQYKCPVN